MISLVMLDLDGTVVGSSARVDDCVWEAVQRVRNAGVKLAVCTGRPGAGVALQVAERLGPRNGHVFQSGAVVSDPSGNTLHVAALREKVVLALVAKARELGHSLELYTPTGVYIERKTPIVEAHAKMIGVTALVRDLQEVARIEPVVRAQWVVHERHRAQVEAVSVDGTQVSSATSPALQDTAFVSVTRDGVDKGSGTRLLAKALSVELANVMAVGDSEGDIPMLEVVGHPFVMANAPAAMRERFPTLARSVDECGIVEALSAAATSRAV